VIFYCCSSVYPSVSGGATEVLVVVVVVLVAAVREVVDTYPVSINQSETRKKNQSESRIQIEH
jgi:hypothetical protein